MLPLSRLCSLPLDEIPFLVIDLETTGLRPQNDGICEVGAIRVQHRRLGATFSSLTNPEKPLSPEAAAIHKITEDDLRHAPFLDAVLPKFLAFAGTSVFVGHNIGFDLHFLYASIRRFGFDIYQWSALDTAHLARHLLPNQRSYGLAALAETLALPTTLFHRALDDARTTAFLLLYLLEEAKKQHPSLQTLADLLHLFPFRSPSFLPPSEPKELLLWLAAEHAFPLQIRYDGAKGSASQRIITPERFQPPFLYAFCHLRQEHRTFRLDRIEILDPRPFRLPEGG